MLHARAVVACLAAATPVFAAAQPAGGAPARVIAYVDADSPRVKASVEKFEAILHRSGVSVRHHVRVQHVAVDVWDREQTAARIRAAVREKPALIIATSSESASVAREVTSSVPIVFGSHQDPVRLGLVRALAEPGGNLTGFTFFAPIDMKRLELLRELAPRARRLGILIDHWWMRETSGEQILREAKERLGLDGQVFLVEKLDGLSVLDGTQARAVDAWYVPTTVLAYEHPSEVVSALARLRKPIVFSAGNFTEMGGLASYQVKSSLDDALQLFARIAGLILDGVEPADIPIERPKAFELVVNAGEARRLGLSLPPALLKRADRVIEAPGAR